MHYGLGFSLNTNLITKIFPGATYNSNQMNIYAQIYDNDDAFTVYEINEPIQIIVDNNDFSTIENLLLMNSSASTNAILSAGFSSKSTVEIQRISSLLNRQSFSDKLGLILTNNAPIFPQIYGSNANYNGIQEVKNLILFNLF